MKSAKSTSPTDGPPQRLAARSSVPIHNHTRPYAALVLEGSYREFGDGGRRQVVPGQLIVHSPFTAHADVAGPAGATIVNFPLSLAASFYVRSGMVEDPAELQRSVAEPDIDLEHYLESRPPAPVPAPPSDTPDLLVEALARPGELALEEWADMHGIHPRTLRRHFRDAVGMTPAHYRWRARTRGAWRQILSTRDPLSSIAADWAFSDQSHLTRSISQLTGRTPRSWRLLSKLSD